LEPVEVLKRYSMSYRLSTAIRIGDAAAAVLLKVRSFPDQRLDASEDWSDLGHVGVEPMLLALSMELALKAWFVFDYDDPNVKRTHNLTKLFDALKQESRQKLDEEFNRSVAPVHPSVGIFGNGISGVLQQHRNAFTDWRYLHEPKRSMMFDQSAFEATLEMVLVEFRKRYRSEPVKPRLRSR
jgi:hypothetical protein